MKPWIYIFITTEKLNFVKMSVTTLLHSLDEMFCIAVVTKKQNKTKNKKRKQNKKQTKQKSI